MSIIRIIAHNRNKEGLWNGWFNLLQITWAVLFYSQKPSVCNFVVRTLRLTAVKEIDGSYNILYDFVFSILHRVENDFCGV